MSVTSSRITSNTSYYIIALTTQKILAFVYFILIARYLGAVDIGHYALAISFIQILGIFIDLGLSPSITRETSRDSQAINKHFSNILVFKIVASFIMLIILIVLANLFGYSGIRLELLYMASGVMILDSFTLTFYAMLRGLHVLKYESLGTVLYQILVIIIVLIGLQGSDVRLLVIALTVASVVNFCWSFFSLRRHSTIRLSLHFNWRIFKALLTIALPFGVTAIFIKLYQLGDTVLLSILSNEKELGWYSVAHKLVFAFEFIPLAFMATVFPAMSLYFETDVSKMKKTFERSSYYLMLIATPMMLGGFVVAKPMVASLYGDEFLQAAPSLQLLLLSLVFIFLNYPLSSLLGAINKQMVNMYFMGITAFISVLLNLFLIPLYGGTGAALTLFISLALLFIAYLTYVHLLVRISLKKYITSLGKTFILSLVMATLVGYGVLYLSWWISILMGIVFYIFLLFIARSVSKEELMSIYAGIKKT